MCGIVGFITAEKVVSTATEKALRNLIVMDTVRGFDSTGAFTVNKDGGKPGFLKKVCTGGEFVLSKEYDKYVNNVNAWATIAHNRAATIGNVDLATAHPFQEGPITLVHNGTLNTTGNLPKSQYQLGANNDSHTIAHNLALTKDYASIIEKLNGAFTLVWHDKRDGNLRVIRNSQRPMHFAAAKNHQTLFLSSDINILKAAMEQSRVEVGKYAKLQPGTLLTFEPGTVIPKIEEVSLGKGYSGGGGYYVVNSSKGAASSGGYKERAASKTPDECRTTVKILGKNRELPTALRDMVTEWGLDPAKPVAFTPAYARVGFPAKGKVSRAACVLGTIDFDGWDVPCEVHCVPSGTAHRNGSVKWAVRLVGMKYAAAPALGSKHDAQLNEQAAIEYDNGEEANLPIFIARLVALSWVPGKKADSKPVTFTVGKNGEARPVVKAEKEDEVAELTISHVKKWGTNQWLSESRFKDEIAGGCIQCGEKNLSVDDADKILWVNDGKDPLCPVCVKQSEEACVS